VEELLAHNTTPSLLDYQNSKETNYPFKAKVAVLFAFITLGFIVFLAVFSSIAFGNRNLPNTYIKSESKAQRGRIISIDGYTLAATKKLYKAVISPHSIDPQKKDIFIKLFSIYSKIKESTIRSKLKNRSSNVVLSYAINPQIAKELKNLTKILIKMKVFVRQQSKSGHSSIHGLDILESGENRIYPYGHLLTPTIGYIHKFEDDGYTKNIGVKGIEKQYEESLKAEQDRLYQGLRDANGYIIFNKESITRHKIDGMDVHLNIKISLQKRIEAMLSQMKKNLRAKEIMLCIMDSKTSKIASLASSNRFNPQLIRKSDYPSLNSNVIEYSFEPGSVLKPIIFALLLEHKKVNPYDIVKTYGGKYKLKNKIITDEHEYEWLSAENVIVHSSNIGIAQLAQKLDSIEYSQGLQQFGFSKKSDIDLSFENAGSIPAVNQLSDEIYKATTSYGYGIEANVMQIMKAYNVFNNMGIMDTPRITDYLEHYNGKHYEVVKPQSKRVLSATTAERVKRILIKTVKEGTGIAAKSAGLIVGGKTGTAQIAKDGHYTQTYNTSFYGFANDKLNRYTIGVTVVEPKTYRFASLTAVPVFKKAVDILIDQNFLTPIINN